MLKKETINIEYRGYNLVVTERSPGWWVHIYPVRHGLLHTHPDHVSGSTKEEALAKARSTVDSRLFA